jgi:hypothetical protein
MHASSTLLDPGYSEGVVMEFREEKQGRRRERMEGVETQMRYHLHGDDKETAIGARGGGSGMRVVGRRRDGC